MFFILKKRVLSWPKNIQECDTALINICLSFVECSLVCSIYSTVEQVNELYIIDPLQLLYIKVTTRQFMGMGSS